MLKKLVKYGNSHALILDKAILELLNIEEGSMIKIKTDGTSIIITPHTTATAATVSETFTQDHAYREAVAKEAIKKQKNIDTKTQEKMEKELALLIKNYQTLNIQLIQNPDFIQKITLLKQEMDPSSPKFTEAYTTLKHDLYPEFLVIEKELARFTNTNQLTSSKKTSLTQTQQQTLMTQEFTAVHKKYHDTYVAYAELLNNIEYQHKAQLLAEKYNFDKDSTDYLQAMDELNHTYLPEWVQAQAELKVIAQNCTNNT